MPAYAYLYSHRSPLLYVAEDHKSNTFIDYHDLHFTLHGSLKTAQWRFHFLSTPYRTKWTFSYPWPKHASFLSALEELSLWSVSCTCYNVINASECSSSSHRWRCELQNKHLWSNLCKVIAGLFAALVLNGLKCFLNVSWFKLHFYIKINYITFLKTIIIMYSIFFFFFLRINVKVFISRKPISSNPYLIFFWLIITLKFQIHWN